MESSCDLLSAPQGQVDLGARRLLRLLHKCPYDDDPPADCRDIERAGDSVTARVEGATDPAGRVALPGGTVLRGTVVEARQSGRVKGRARLSVDFDRIVVRGKTHELEASPITVEAPDDHGRDAKIVGGAAAAGAIIGAIADGKEGFAKGAVIGGAGGTGAVLLTRGHDIQIPAGSRFTVTVKDSVRL